MRPTTATDTPFCRIHSVQSVSGLFYVCSQRVYIFIHKRYQRRIFCLQKLRSLNVSAALLRSFYRSCVESVLTVLFLCWFGGLNVKSKNVLNKVVNVCGKVVGERQ